LAQEELRIAADLLQEIQFAFFRVKQYIMPTIVDFS